MNNQRRHFQNRPSSQTMTKGERFSETNRLSRYDRSSKIPRMNQRSSVDRVSGVLPIDRGSMSGSRSASKFMSRNRSIDSIRYTMNPSRSKIDSAQRPGHKRPRSVSYTRETPVYMTPNMGTMNTPMSVQSHRASHQRTPSNERMRSTIEILEKALSHVPVKEMRSHTESIWSKEKCDEVVERLKNNPLTERIIPNGASPLKPISCNLFLDITNALFSRLCSGNHFVDIKNYTEKIPEIAAKLSYTGVMSKSWLKSVYCSHTYPHMIAFFSYLLDLNEMQERFKNNMSIETVYGDEKILKILHDYYTKAWNAYQDNVNDDFEHAEDGFIYDYQDSLGVSDNAKKILEHKLDDTKNKLDKANNEYDIVSRTEEKLYKELMIVKNRSEQLKEMEKELNNEIKSSQASCVELKSSLENMEKNIRDLEIQSELLQSQLNNQKMSIKERNEILKDIHYLKECCNSKNDVFTEMEKVAFEKDLELARAQKEALQASTSINKSLMKVSLAVGKDLINYSLNERDLILKDTPIIIQNTIEEVEKLKNEAKLRLQKASERKDSETLQMLELQKKIELSYEVKKNLENSILSKKKECSELQKIVDQLKENLEEKRKVHNELKNGNSDLQTKFQEAIVQFDYWKSEQHRWENCVYDLKKCMQSAKDTYEKQAEEVILEYIERVKNTIPDVSKLQIK